MNRDAMHTETASRAKAAYFIICILCNRKWHMICGGRGENVDNGGRDSHNNGLLSRVGEGRDSEGSEDHGREIDSENDSEKCRDKTRTKDADNRLGERLGERVGYGTGKMRRREGAGSDKRLRHVARIRDSDKRLG